MKKLFSLLLCLCMVFTTAALGEEGTDTLPTTTAVELQDSDVLLTVNGEDVTWAEISPMYDSLVANYGSNYDMADNANVELFRAVAMENAISEKLLAQKAVEFGLSLTQEEATNAEASAQSNWDAAIQSYLSYNYPTLTEESSQEERDAANAAAVQYFNDLGFTPESLKEDAKRYALFGKVQTLVTQDATVTDEEVEAMYQSLVAADKELYENDISAYVDYNSYVEMLQMYYGAETGMDSAWYRPAGFRYVKHILLPVDETLMSNYQDLQARLEEQMEDELVDEEAAQAAPTQEATETAEATGEAAATPTLEPVTQADVDNAKAEILASLAEKIDEINQKIAQGVDFDELIATYAVNEDGSATDGGMTTEPTKTTGYEVAQASTNYVAPFVEAAFSVDSIGEVSAPYISDFGVHIVKYIGDVPEGPIPMTDAQRESKRTELLQSKQNELYTAAMDNWIAESEIVYSGIIPTMSEIEAREAAAQEAAAQEPAEAMVEEEAAQDAPAESAQPETAGE